MGDLMVVEGGISSSCSTNLSPNIQQGFDQFLEQIDEELESANSPTDGQRIPEVVLEIRINGYLYTLTRLPVQETKSTINLSPREQEVVRLVTKGLPNKAIAIILDISPWTVATHLRRVYAKLGVSSRAEMVACVVKRGLPASFEFTKGRHSSSRE